MDTVRRAISATILLLIGGGSVDAQESGVFPRPFPVANEELESLFLEPANQSVSLQELEIMQRVYFAMACKASYGVMYNIIGDQIAYLEEWLANARELDEEESITYEQRQRELAEQIEYREETRVSANGWLEFANIGLGALGEVMPRGVREEIAAEAYDNIYRDFVALNKRIISTGQPESDYLKLCPPNASFDRPGIVKWD